MEEVVTPDLQASMACEDVRMEVNGSQTLVGVINAIFAPQLPVRLLKFCLWTRWSSGAGKFLQKARIMSPDEEKVICENQVTFELNHLEAHATNVHFFPGLQFDVYGAYHVEIYLGDDLKLRYPLCVVKLEQQSAVA
ncbi:MAG: hypothetical protein R3F23_07615 [Verrucomicrobiia bacterium]